VYDIHEILPSKNNECLGVNIFPQITGSSISGLADLKKFLGGGGNALRPPRGKGPLLTTPALRC